MYLTHLQALEMGKQLRNAVLNNFDRDRSGYDDIDGKSRLAQAHELLNYFILSVRILQKDAVTVHLLYHGIFLFSVLRRTHLLFGMYSYNWIHTLILLSSLNSSFIEL